MASLGERDAGSPCTQCSGPATRTFGTDLYCEWCLEEFLGPIREAVAARDALTGIGQIIAPRPDWGPGWYDLRCSSCAAEWVGPQGEPCDWCAAALIALIEDQRQLLLWPDWLTPTRGPRYDELDEVSKAVWDRTRGQTIGTGSKRAWITRLVRGVESGLITQNEADQACDRYDREYADGDT